MNFTFLLGSQEQHQVDFAFDQFLGNLEIRVDGGQRLPHALP